MELESHKIHLEGWVTFGCVEMTKNRKDKDREAIMHGTYENKINTSYNIEHLPSACHVLRTLDIWSQ